MDRVAVVQQELDRNIIYWAMKRAIKDEVLKPSYSADDLVAAIPRIMDDLKLAPKLRNLIYDIARERNFCSEDACLQGAGGQSASSAAALTLSLIHI